MICRPNGIGRHSSPDLPPGIDIVTKMSSTGSLPLETLTYLSHENNNVREVCCLALSTSHDDATPEDSAHLPPASGMETSRTQAAVLKYGYGVQPKHKSNRRCDLEQVVSPGLGSCQ